jgi:hypothetical protein
MKAKTIPFFDSLFFKVLYTIGIFALGYALGGYSKTAAVYSTAAMTLAVIARHFYLKQKK